MDSRMRGWGWPLTNRTDRGVLGLSGTTVDAWPATIHASALTRLWSALYATHSSEIPSARQMSPVIVRMIAAASGTTREFTASPTRIRGRGSDAQAPLGR